MWCKPPISPTFVCKCALVPHLIPPCMACLFYCLSFRRVHFLYGPNLFAIKFAKILCTSSFGAPRCLWTSSPSSPFCSMALNPLALSLAKIYAMSSTMIRVSPSIRWVEVVGSSSSKWMLFPPFMAFSTNCGPPLSTHFLLMTTHKECLEPFGTIIFPMTNKDNMTCTFLQDQFGPYIKMFWDHSNNFFNFVMANPIGNRPHSPHCEIYQALVHFAQLCKLIRALAIIVCVCMHSCVSWLFLMASLCSCICLQLFFISHSCMPQISHW